MAVDPYVRMTAAMNHFKTADRVTVAQMSVQSTFSLYPYISDAFAWLSMAGLLGLVVWGRRIRLRE